MKVRRNDTRSPSSYKIISRHFVNYLTCQDWIVQKMAKLQQIQSLLPAYVPVQDLLRPVDTALKLFHRYHSNAYWQDFGCPLCLAALHRSLQAVSLVHKALKTLEGTRAGCTLAFKALEKLKVHSLLLRIVPRELSVYTLGGALGCEILDPSVALIHTIL